MRYLMIVTIGLLLACGQPQQGSAPATPPPSETRAPPETGTPETGTPETGTIIETTAPSEDHDRNISIDSVQVANPVVVTGRARTFENSVSLRLRDARGALLTETFTTSNGEMGNHNPYRATLWVTRDPGGSITVEALEYSAKDGSEQSLVSAGRPFSVQPIDARLYFPDDQCTRVNPHTRRIPKSVSAARLLVEALIAGPTAAEKAAGAANPFPKGSRVESVNLRDGTLTVDFNDRVQNVGGSCAAGMIRESVTQTLSALPSVKKVLITAGGSEKLALQP